MANEYIINWADGTKPTVTIEPKTLNTTAASVVIYGKGYNNYGEGIQENILRLMEHFCSPTAPTYPTEGQVWYDKTSQILRVYDGTQWRTFSSRVVVATTSPTGLQTGDMWLNSSNNRFHVWQGSSFTELARATDLTTHTANTGIHLSAGEKTTISQLAGTSAVSTDLNNIVGTTSNVQTQLNAKFNKAGGQLTGFAFTHSYPDLEYHVANRGYVDRKVTELARLVFNGTPVYRHNFLYTTYATTSSQTIFSGLPDFDTGDDSMVTFINGVYQWTDTSMGAANAGENYSVTAANEITLTSGVPEDTEVTCFGTFTDAYETTIALSAPNTLIDNVTQGYHTVTGSTLVAGGTITTPSTQYTETWFFVDGVKQIKGSYTQATTTVAFSEDLPVGTVVSWVIFTPLSASGLVGTLTAGPAGTTYTDSAKSWAGSELVGKWIEFTSGAALGKKAKITANTATTYTVEQAVSPAPSSADAYRISYINQELVTASINGQQNFNLSQPAWFIRDLNNPVNPDNVCPMVFVNGILQGTQSYTLSSDVNNLCRSVFLSEGINSGETVEVYAFNIGD